MQQLSLFTFQLEQIYPESSAVSKKNPKRSLILKSDSTCNIYTNYLIFANSKMKKTWNGALWPIKKYFRVIFIFNSYLKFMLVC
ncbi:hypothetical protein HZS_5503 [Henneguya salminicola]|nr:hypothetical protein HZS_5503 [Henneguya salminicola]